MSSGVDGGGSGGRGTGKGDRILDAAEALVRARGFKAATIAEIAKAAHIGKGTVYLYWPTKEALVLALLARTLSRVLDQVAGMVRESPESAAPQRFCPLLVRAIVDEPMVRALQTEDSGVLGAIIDDPRSRDIRQRGITALIRELVPVWQANGLARDDWPVDRLSSALELICFGYLQALVRRDQLDGIVAQDGDRAVVDAIGAVAARETTEASAAQGGTDVVRAIDDVARTLAALAAGGAAENAVAAAQ